MRRHYSRRTGGNRGLEAAKRHIEEAHQLSQELGGTDKDVKQWFFDLPALEREKIFVKYSVVNGADAGDYARKTFNDWRTGKTQMSGLVAGRLFSLLPPIMPLDAKFQLVDSLWNHVAPSKKRVVTAGTTTPINDLVDIVSKEVRELTTNWEIPVAMQKRFTWLSYEDAVTYQKLLQYIRDSERRQGETILRDQIPILKQKFDTDLAETTSRLSYTIEVGKQSVELRLIRELNNISVGDWTPEPIVQVKSKDNGVPIWVWIVGFLLLMIFLNNKYQ